MKGSVQAQAHLPAGYQRHPGTHTAHFFDANTKISACNREQRHNGPLDEVSTSFMVCSRCMKTEARQAHELVCSEGYQKVEKV